MSIEEFVSNYGNIITLGVVSAVYASAVIYTLTQKGEEQKVKQENFDDLRYMHNKTYSLDDFMFR